MRLLRKPQVLTKKSNAEKAGTTDATHLSCVGCAFEAMRLSTANRAHRLGSRRTAMKKLFAIVALTTLISAQAFTQAAVAAPTSAQAAACTYDGYPCSAWKGIHDGW
jgi:hypothetical protein